MRDPLDLIAIASPGQTVFLQMPAGATADMATKLRHELEATYERTEIHIVLLDDSIKVARIEP